MTTVTIQNVKGEYHDEWVVSGLRYIERDGQKILQQRWQVNGPRTWDRSFEWRDVPTEQE